VSSLADLRDFASHAREIIRDRLKAELDVDVTPPPPPPPPPPPEPEPPPPVQQATPKEIKAEPPPAPAQAAKVLTQEPDPNEPVDLTGEGFVTGNAESFAGGITANTGTSTRPVRETNATPLGVPGGTGKGTEPVPVQDLSRPAMPDRSVTWNDCGFTPEADLEGINEAIVMLAVTVGSDGRAKSVTVIKDPGYGFGRLARACALRKPFVVGLDRSGKPVGMTTPPFRVIFRR
jgi:protein TonB